MVTLSDNFLNQGIYTIPDAARLSGASAPRIRTWMQDLRSEKLQRRAKEGIWKGQLSPIGEKEALGFLDLNEVRFIKAFRDVGVGWKMIRGSHEVASKKYETEHPFCTRQFLTDGKHILEEFESEFQETIKGQILFPDVIKPFIRELEFSDNETLLRWWPLGREKSIVLDPKRQFGKPIAAESGVSTEVLYYAVEVEQSIEEVADWYEVNTFEVEDAVNFERSLRGEVFYR